LYFAMDRSIYKLVRITNSKVQQINMWLLAFWREALIM
jgi:hypothetical protein